MEGGVPDVPGYYERLWCRHFAAFADPDLRVPIVFVCAGQPPTLAYPTDYDAALRELTCAWALCESFRKVYGEEVQARTVADFPALAATFAEPRGGRDEDAA